jgi:hypothetical protein
MLVKLADKQVLTAPAPNPSDIYTDPIELGRFNRASAILVCQYVHGDMVFHYFLEVSNDLEEWVTVGTEETFTGPTQPAPQKAVRSVSGRYLRAHLWLDGGTSGTTGHVCVDLKVRLDVESLEQ